MQQPFQSDLTLSAAANSLSVHHAAIRLDRVFWGRLCSAAAILAMCIAGYNFQRNVKQGQWPYQLDQIPMPYAALIWLLIGSLALAAAIVLLRPQLELMRREAVAFTAVKVRWRLIVPGIAALLVFTEANAQILIQDFYLPFHVQGALFFGGLGAFMFGMGGYPRRLPDLRVLLVNRTFLTLLAILVVGMALRVWRLEDLIHFPVDEIEYVHGVVDFNGVWFQPLIHPMKLGAQGTHFYPYFTYWAVSIFGYSQAGLRATSVIFGLLTIIAVWFLARTLFDNKTGLLAAAVLALLPVHVHFSRNAMFNIVDPFFGTLGLALLVYGLRRGSQRAYVAAGACLGFTTYLYEGGRFVFLALLVLWLVGLVIWLRPRTHWRGLSLLIGIAILIMLPFYLTLPRLNSGVTDRLESQGVYLTLLRQDLQTVSLPEALVNHFNRALRYTLLRLVYTPDQSNLYYPVGTAIIPWYVVPFFLLGVVFALLRLRQPGIAILLWLLIGCGGISLLTTFEYAPRFCVILPPLAMMIAIGLRYPLEMAFPRRWLGKRVSPRVLRDVTVGALIVVSSVALLDYFNQMPDYNSRIRRYYFKYDYIDAYYRAIENALGGRLVIITPDEVNQSMMKEFQSFLNSKVSFEIWKPADLTPQKVATLPDDLTRVFALPPGDEALSKLLRSALNVDELPDTPYVSVPEEQRFAMYIARP